MKRPSTESVLIGALLLSVAGLGYLQYQSHQDLTSLRESSASQGQQLGSVIEEFSPDREVLQQLGAQVRAQAQTSDDVRLRQAQLQERIAGWEADLQSVREEQAEQSAIDLSGELAEQLEALEQKVAELAASRSRPVSVRSSPSKPTNPSVRKPAFPQRTFDIHGIESRAGALFLVVAPSGVQQLNAMRLLTAGDSVGTWRLDSLSANSALFVVPGHAAQTVSLK